MNNKLRQEILKESIRKNIIKEINKLLKEAPEAPTGTKGTKDNPYTVDEFKQFENSGMNARAATSQALGKETMGAKPLPQ